MAAFEIPEDEKGLNEFLDKIEGEGRRAQRDRDTTWEKAMRLYHTGRTERPGKNDAAQFRANLIAPSVHRKGALLTETKPRLDVQPRSSGFLETPKLLRRVILADWDECSVQAALEDLCTLYVQVLNSGFMECGWDAQAAYDLGSVALNAIDPRQVIVDPAIVRARDLDQAQYVRVNSIVPLYVAAALYPGTADDLRPTRKILPTEADTKDQSGLGGKIRSWVTGSDPGRPEAPFERVELATYWFRDPRTDDEDNPLYPGGRCVVRANEETICLVKPFSAEALRDETRNPYYDGLWPYEWLDNMPDFDTAWGRDEITAARWIQRTFDLLGNTTVDTMLTNARPFILAPKNTLDPDTVNMLRRLRHVVLEYAAGRGDVVRQPSPIPTSVYLQLMQMCQAILDYTQGMQDTGGGMGGAKGRIEARSPAMLEGLQNAAQVLVRAQARRLEAFLERLGTKWISRIFQFMTTDRLLWYSGGEKTLRKVDFERAKLTDEILQVALQKAVAQHKQDEDKRIAEIKRDAEEKGVIPLVQPTAPPGFLKEDQILGAIKGAWREFTFRVIPLSSLAQTRMGRAQLFMAMNAQALIPASDILEELDIENPEDKLKKAVEEAKERQGLGVPALAQPKKKGGAK